MSNLVRDYATGINLGNAYVNVTTAETLEWLLNKTLERGEEHQYILLRHKSIWIFPGYSCTNGD